MGRASKLADQIQEVVASMLERRVKDPRLGFVTVTDVRMTNENKDATVFYTVLGDDAEQASTAAALRSATGLLRSQVGKQLGMKFTPTLTFVADTLPSSAREIEELLVAARSDDDRRAAQAARAEYAGDPDPYRKPDPDDGADEGTDDAGTGDAEGGEPGDGEPADRARDGG